MHAVSAAACASTLFAHTSGPRAHEGLASMLTSVCRLADRPDGAPLTLCANVCVWLWVTTDIDAPQMTETEIEELNPKEVTRKEAAAIANKIVLKGPPPEAQFVYSPPSIQAQDLEIVKLTAMVRGLSFPSYSQCRCCMFTGVLGSPCVTCAYTGAVCGWHLVHFCTHTPLTHCMPLFGTLLGYSLLQRTAKVSCNGWSGKKVATTGSISCGPQAVSSTILQRCWNSTSRFVLFVGEGKARRVGFVASLGTWYLFSCFDFWILTPQEGLGTLSRGLKKGTACCLVGVAAYQSHEGIAREAQSFAI